MDPVTIIGAPRDRFSTTERWLDSIFDNTPGAGTVHPVLFVAGGVPPYLRERWVQRFGDRVEFHFRDEFINQAECRNIGLTAAQTEFAVVADNDTYPRQGWLEAMVRCQQETGAVMVSPLILQTPTEIHCAGTDLYRHTRDGRDYGHKHLRYYKMPYADSANLERSPIDYGELHLQLMEVAPTLELGVWDEEIFEVGEVDSGLTWAKGGHSMYFEPEAVVLFDLEGPIDESDVAYFAWRWDYDNVNSGYLHFERKWGFDMTEEGSFDNFMVDYNAIVGALARRYPSAFTVKLGVASKKLGDKLVFAPRRARRKLRRAKLGATSKRLGA